MASPLVGTLAYKAGVRAGDKIVAINGASTVGKSINEIVRSLRGKAGEAVSISVVREGHAEPIDFQLVRARIKVDSILGDVRQLDGSWNFLLGGEDRIGYVRLASFGA